MLGILFACQVVSTEPVTAVFDPHQADVLPFAQSDNPEVLVAVPDEEMVLVISSKSHKLSLIDVGQTLSVVREAVIPTAGTESELTHVAIHPDGTWAAVTETVVGMDGDGGITSCSGKVHLVSLVPDAFGDVLLSVEVGPMPDAVDVTDTFVVVANERDVVWGKCAEVENLEEGSVSVIDVTQGPNNASEIQRWMLADGNLDREPEDIVVVEDHVYVTLQDSHEWAKATLGPAGIIAEQIQSLQPNHLGQEAWPDGVTAFSASDGSSHLAIAGEGNDTLYIMDAEGDPISQLSIEDGDIPDEYPRDGSWGPLFVPDSLASLKVGDKSLVLATLKGAGAALLIDVGNPADPQILGVIKLGQRNELGIEGASEVSPEGITVGNGYAVVANEGEGSLSLIRF